MKKLIAVLVVVSLVILVLPFRGFAESGSGFSLQSLAGNYVVKSSQYHPFDADGAWIDVTIQSTDPKNHRSVKFFDQGMKPDKVQSTFSVRVDVSKDGNSLIMNFYGLGNKPIYANKRIAKVMMQVLRQ